MTRFHNDNYHIILEDSQRYFINVSHISLLYSSTACLLPSNCSPPPWGPPSSSCSWWTSAPSILGSCQTLSLQCSHVCRERVVHFLLHVPPKKVITWVAVRWVGGPGVPPQALDGKHPVLEDGVQPLHDHPGLVWLGTILLPHRSSELG